MITIQVTEEEAAVLFKVLSRIEAATPGPRLGRKARIVDWLRSQGVDHNSDFYALAREARAAGLYSSATYIGDIARSLASHLKGGK